VGRALDTSLGDARSRPALDQASRAWTVENIRGPALADYPIAPSRSVQDLNVRARVRLIFEPGLYVFRNLDVEQGAVLKIPANTWIYVTGTVASSAFAATSTPTPPRCSGDSRTQRPWCWVVSGAEPSSRRRRPLSVTCATWPCFLGISS
jgi:hypothetical protein